MKVLLIATLILSFVPISLSVTQPTATISGTISYDGIPVSGVEVLVVWDGGERFSITGSDGAYSVSGIAIDGRIMVFVRPSIEDRLAYRNWGTEPLSGDLVKDFELEPGHLLSGEFRDPNGTPISKGFWLEVDYLDGSPAEGEWIGGGVDEMGRFSMVLPRGYYALQPPFQPLRPYFMPRTRLDLHNSDVTNLVVSLVETPDPYPITPPRADRIDVSEPDVDGYATISGHAGAVEPISPVILINLSAQIFETTTADARGAFSAVLFAPPGSSLLIKYDSSSTAIDAVKHLAQTEIVDTSVIDRNLNPLPGTILQVGAATGVGEGPLLTFESAGGLLGESTSWAGWWLSGELHEPLERGHFGFAVARGQHVRLSLYLRITSPALHCREPLSYRPDVHIGLRFLFGKDGHSKPWGSWFNAHLFTPTGLPIEHEAGGEQVGVASGAFESLRCISPHSFEGNLEMSFPIPERLPDGIYLPTAFVGGGGVPGNEGMPLIKVWYRPDPYASLPPLLIGVPSQPHIPWTLLGDYPINGHRGVQAFEDRDRFAMPTRVVLPPHQVVVPRIDERTGESLVYRLEPGSHWLAGTDRRQPNPPHIPLALPSGELTVEVLKPDGTTDFLGPATIKQSSVRTPTIPGGDPLAFGTGHIGDLFHITTMDDDFAYSFDQYGRHLIALRGRVYDVFGNTYEITGTYEIHVARILDLDPAQLPTTPYMQGDAFAPGLHIFPPVPAGIGINLVHMPYSDAGRMVIHTIEGQANRFGYFQPEPGTEIRFQEPGEFRVDISAIYEDPDGTLWMGTMTWGNVVEGSNALIEAHGRRGLDYKSERIDDMPSWFEIFNLPPEKLQGAIEVYYPYFSGDIHWGNEDNAPGDSIHTAITIRDKTPQQSIYQILQDHFPRTRSCYRWPPEGCSLSGLNKRIDVGEAPLFITTRSGIDPAVEPEDIDMWGYWYGSSERPDVHVREIISEDGMGTAYWRFDDTYGYQIGEGALGDLPGDLKWEFGGAVLRAPEQGIIEYAIYSSLWVLLPHGDPIGARITPPFQDATGAGINGGPILTIKGEEIDMLFLPKGVRPGDILELGNTISFSGHVGPPLDSRVSITVTAPSGATSSRTWHANKIGWLYDPSFDFIAEETGLWTVDISVLHDRPYVGNGVIPQSHNTGTVLGTNGRYEFYVVSDHSQRLQIASPYPGFLFWPDGQVDPITIQGMSPAGATAVHYTVHDKGIVMDWGSVEPNSDGTFSIVYDAKALNADFPMLSLTAHEGRWEGLADEVAINLLALGAGEPHANTVTLIGEEVFIGHE